MEKSFQTKEQLSDFFTTLSRGATPDPESADISTSAMDPDQQKLPTPSLPSELDLHTTPQEVLPYHFKGNTTNFFERARGAEIYATMPRHKSRSKVARSLAQSNNGPCVTPVSGQQLSPKRQLIAATHPRSAAARRAEGFSELLQFTRQQQFTPLGDMDIAQSLPSFASGKLSLDDARGTPLDDEDRLCDDLGESKGDSIAVSKSIPQQPSGEILDKKPRPGQEGSGKVSTIPQLQVVPESSESLHTVEEANEKPEFAISPPLGDSDHEKEDSAPSICVTADDMEEKSEKIETNGLLDDAKTDTELATSPPVGATEQGEIEPEKSSHVTMLTESLAEKSEGGEMLMETSKPEETNGRGESISPPLADSSDDIEERELTETARDIAAESSVQKSEETKTTTIDDGELHDSSESDQSKESTPQTAVSDYETSNTTEANSLQQNGDSPYHLRHRVTGAEQQTVKEQDQPETEISDISATIIKASSKEPSDSTTTSVLDSFREERESSVESGASERHSELVQQSSPLYHRSAQATGMLGWLQGVSRHVLFGLLPRTVGLRGGLIVVGVAAISSLLLYNLTGYASANSTAGGR